jgi:hypothetical protein
MTKQTINTGATPNDKQGDSLRGAFTKINSNFTELYTALGLNVDGTLNIGAFEFAGSVMSTTDSSAIVIDQATTITSNLTVGGDVLPSVSNGGDLGSSARPWRSLYVSNNTIFLGSVPLSLDASNNLTVNGSRVSAAWPVTNTSGSSGPTKVAIGRYAGEVTQGAHAVAIGDSAGYTGQVAGAVAIGWQTGETTQGNSAVAIGNSAGKTSQGASAVAIGLYAGYTDQAANTIILNASGSAVNGVAAQTNSFYVAPIRADATPGNVLYYNTTIKEVTYGTPIVPNGTKASTDTGTAGQTSYDSQYFYVCVATNSWRRMALGSY